jgi:hypothetical protein
MGASKNAVATADPAVAHGPESAGSAAAKRLRSKGSGGIFLVRDGVWRVDVEVGRDKVTGRRRRVSRQVEGSRRDAEAALARLKVAAEQRTPLRRSCRCAGVSVEVSGVESGVLDGAVEEVDVFVGGRCQGDGVSVVVGVEPTVGDRFDVLLEGAGNDAAAGGVGVDDGGVAAAQGEGGVGFPSVGESVHLFEVVDAVGAAEFVEHAAAFDGLELHRIADEPQPPSLAVDEVGEAVEVGGGEQAGFVDDQPCRSRESPLIAGWPVGLRPFVEEFGDGVGSDTGAAG